LSGLSIAPVASQQSSRFGVADSIQTIEMDVDSNIDDRDGDLDLSVVVPVYRSATTLPELVRRLKLSLDSMDVQYELIFVDDGSPDNAWTVLRELQCEYPDRIVLVQLMRNYGQHNATMCGFRHARGKIVVTIDDDLQIPPEEIPKLIRTLDSDDADIVYGHYEQKKHSWPQRIVSYLVGLAYRRMFKTSVTVTSFRAIRRPLVESILDYDLSYILIDGMMAWNTQRVSRVMVKHYPRLHGESSYSMGRRLVMIASFFCNFSMWPLQQIMALGFLSATAGFAVGLFYLILWLSGRITVPGYASTIIAIVTMGGIQLLSLGVMGEYIGRIHMNVNRRPQYRERQVCVARVENNDKAPFGSRMTGTPAT
jgi:polyisoprenyl-phosphate glycosyltransferase